MQRDPFGNLMDWGDVLNSLEYLADSGRLDECQSGLVRILRFKGNWRLREEVLKRVEDIRTPTKALLSELLSILANDNIYYDARVMAGDALIGLLKKANAADTDEVTSGVKAVVEKLMDTIQPPFFGEALSRLQAGITVPCTLEN